MEVIDLLCEARNLDGDELHSLIKCKLKMEAVPYGDVDVIAVHSGLCEFEVEGTRTLSPGRKCCSQGRL
jgi:hypothetical protein